MNTGVKNANLILHNGESVRLDLEVSRALQDILRQDVKLIVIPIERDVEPKRLAAQAVGQAGKIRVVSKLRQGVCYQV